jgi:filamentous hemagglutinin
MKYVYLVGFRGTGFRSERYQDEPLLIRAGHVGFYFEDEPGRIFGFHPTEQAVNAVGDDQAVINWLKRHRVLEGRLHNDTAIFHRAYELAQSGALTVVWQMAIPLEDKRYDQIREQAEQWYNDNRVFMYSFPPAEPKADRDNCATFPRKLGLPLPESTGNLREYIPALQANGELWSPEGE